MTFKENNFYNKEKIIAMNYEMSVNVFDTPLSSFANQILTLFIIPGSKPIMIKWRDFQSMVNPYIGDCFSIVESLLLINILFFLNLHLHEIR